VKKLDENIERFPFTTSVFGQVLQIGNKSAIAECREEYPNVP
jgi:hypothetical protein